MNPEKLPKSVQDCHALLVWLIPLLDKFPRNRRFTLGERLESGLLDVLELLTTAAYSRNKGESLTQAIRRLNTVVHLWRLAHELRVISAKRYGYGAKLLDDLGRQLGAWQRHVSKAVL